MGQQDTELLTNKNTMLNFARCNCSALKQPINQSDWGQGARFENNFDFKLQNCFTVGLWEKNNPIVLLLDGPRASNKERRDWKSLFSMSCSSPE